MWHWEQFFNYGGVVMAQQSFEQALANFVREIESATGIGEEGDRLGPGRFSGFHLTDDIKRQIRSAVEMIKEGKPETEAIGDLQITRDHFISKQKAYLRNKALPDLGRLVASLSGVVEKDLIEPVRARVRELDKYCQGKDVDLNSASVAYWEIIGIAECARTEHQTRIANQRRARKAAEEASQQQAAMALAERCHRRAENLEQKYAALLE